MNTDAVFAFNEDVVITKSEVSSNSADLFVICFV